MKLQITMQNGALAGQKKELTNGALTIGREEISDLRFDLNERLVSKKHAVIRFETDGFYLVDSNSTNGTFVNGIRISRVKLNSGDIVQFGDKGSQALVKIENSDFIPQVKPLGNSFNFPPRPPQTSPQNTYQNQQQNYGYNPPINNANFADNSNNFNQSNNYENRASTSTVGQSFANLGFSEASVKANPDNTKKYIVAALALVVAVFLALMIAGLTVFELGLPIALMATIIAFAPAVIYVLPLLWLDRYDPEPPVALALCFAWGALVATFTSLIVNTIFAAIFGEVAGAIVSAPIVEEGAKGLGVLLLLIFWRRDFDGIVDGIVYGGVIALGFATVENVLYYGRTLSEIGVGGLLVVFVLRGILSPFAHVIFTSMTGIGCGIARESHNKVLRILMPLVGYIAAVTLHAIWNTLASIGGLGGFLVGYIILEIPFFLIFLGFAVYLMRRENKILNQTLAVEVAKGVISEEQKNIATSAFRSLNWMFSGLSNGKFNARRQFLRATAKTGLAWWHIQLATAAKGETRSFQQIPILEKEILRWREQV
ncbi:MAG: PrsW family intramembrane metalloprotease [Pyrinomonadaceae bacterium]|nr:PrsW family intramembrane metalloprotease [Pyrinomonadaceae bacterium]